MAITYPRALPSEMVIERCSMKAKSLVAVTASPFTGEQQVHAHSGQFWEADITVAPSERGDAAAIHAWLLSLNGREKTLLFGDPAGATARGSASTTPGTPVVNGADQTGASLICNGGPIGATNYLRVGDYIQLGSGSTATLHQVLEDVSTDGSGNFTLNLWPNIRSAPANGATVTVDNAVGKFRLDSNVNSWSESTVLYGISFKIKEAF